MARLDNFEEVGQNYDQDGVPRTVGTSDWPPMMRVCRRWWAVARSTPRLWRSIDVYRSKNWLDLCISRSAEATLEVSFHDEDTALVAILTVISVAHRISRLLLPGIWDINFKRISPLLEPQMSSLVEIGISRYYKFDGSDEDEDDGEDLPLELLPDRFPALTTLHMLDREAMPLSSTLLSNLSFLEITDDMDRDLLTTQLSAFLDVLKSCTRLEEFHLKQCLCNTLDYPDLLPDTKLTLPKLRKLVITMYARNILPLLQCLCLPIDVEIIISIVNTVWDDSYAEEICFFQQYIIPPGPPRSHIAVFHSATYGRIVVRENMMTLVAQETLHHHHGITIEYELRDHDLGPVFGYALSEFSDIIINAPIDSLTVYGDIDYTSQDEWSLLFSRLPKLESLTLTCSGKSHCADIFLALAAPPTPTSTPLPCPKLRALDIRGNGRCSDKDLVNIYCALQLRAMNGAPALRTLWFQTKHENEAAFQARKALAAQMFTELMPDGGGRYDRVMED